MLRRSILILCLASIASAPVRGQEPDAAPNVDMAAMMAKAQALTAPGKHHEHLRRFLGAWETATRVTMAGMPDTPERGTAKGSWLIEGRWIKIEGSGTLMGMPHQTFYVLGYDNFKQSFVSMAVGSIDTAMLNAEGDLDQGGKTLITYGTLDEYLTGEHDKMVKYIWRFQSDDRMVFEVHDLPIGETNTQVFEVVYQRKK